MKKIAIIAIAFFLVLVIGLTVFVKIYVTPERIRTFLIPTAEKTLNRKVELGEVHVGLFKGIDVKNFAIKEADGQTDFLRCESFILKFQLLPLLAKKVIIDELRLASPEVKIERNAKGVFNFEDIGKKETPAETEKTATEELPISLLVSNVSVTKSRFSLVDQIKDLPNLKGSFDVDMSMESTSKSELSSRGVLKLVLDELIIQKPSRRQLKNLTADLDYAAMVNIKTNDVRLEKASLTYQGIPLSLSGDIKNYKDAPSLALALSLPKVKAEKLMAAASPFASVEGLKMAGSVAADLKVDGQVKQLESMKATGKITLDQLNLLYQDVDLLLDGDLTLKEQLMNVDVKGTVNKNSAQLTGSVSNLFKNQRIKMNLYAEKLSLDELIPAGKPAAAKSAGETGKTGKKAGAEAEPVNLKLTAEGEIRIDSATYKGMLMNDFFARYRFSNNTLEIREMKATAGKGQFSLNSTVNLSRPGYQYALASNLDSLHGVEVVNAFFPKAKDTVFGLLSFNLKLNGAGTLPASMKRNLAGNADFNIKEGKITNAKLTSNLSRFLNIPELSTINLTKADGTVRIGNGIARLDSLFSSDDLTMDPTGNIGLDETLDLAFDLKLSPRLTDKAMRNSSIAQYIKNEEGWGMIPLKVKGTLSDPSYQVDVAKAGKRVIEKKVDKLLDKLLKKDEEGQAPTAPEEKKESPVKDLLRDLF